jgi:signal transduction histidine kinase
MAIITKAAQERAKLAGREFDLDLRLSNTPVRINENRLKKLVEELVDNAFKYSQAGTSVRLNSLSMGDSYILYVLDNGRGILPAQAEKMGAYVQFERRIYEQQGSGLGFAIAKRLVELHGGKIIIDSIPGRQTLIKVTLPAESKVAK